MYEILRYIFWFLVSIPIFVIGIVLFVKLSHSVMELKDEENRRKEEIEKEKERRRQFDMQYRRRHPGE